MARDKGAPAATGVRRSEQRERTRRRLLQLARAEFARFGYEGASTERLVARAGLTRGALYHQFEDKRALFAAVLAEAQADILGAIERAAVMAASPWDSLRDGCRAFLDTASRPTLSRIVLIDGPAVVGWREWRRMDDEHGVQSLREGLRAALGGGAAQNLDLDAMAVMLSGAMNEAALWICHQKDRAEALGKALQVLDCWLEPLRNQKSAQTQSASDRDSAGPPQYS